MEITPGYEFCGPFCGLKNSERIGTGSETTHLSIRALAFAGAFSPVLAKHSEHFSLGDALSIGVDRMQRNFDPMRQQVERWRGQQLSAEAAKLTIYQAFIEGDLEVPRHLARRIQELYFNPQYGEFEPRTMWSLSNVFTSALKGACPHSAIQSYRQAG